MVVDPSNPLVAELNGSATDSLSASLSATTSATNNPLVVGTSAQPLATIQEVLQLSSLPDRSSPPELSALLYDFFDPQPTNPGSGEDALHNTPGVFTVQDGGEVSVDFLFDGGSYAGELGLFSLEGMEILTIGSPEYFREAARRALQGPARPQGQDPSQLQSQSQSQSQSQRGGAIVLSDVQSGAEFSGDLGESSRNRGAATGTQWRQLQAGEAMALIFVPRGTIAQAAEGQVSGFVSLGAGGNQFALVQQDDQGFVLAIEDLEVGGRSDRDYNDLIVRVQGLDGTLLGLDSVLNLERDWRSLPLAQQILTRQSPTGDPVPPINPVPPIDPVPPTGGGGTIAPQTAIATTTIKIAGNVPEAQVAATGAAKLTLGSQRIYIGTSQVTAKNQNPLIVSFDDQVPGNNWSRNDYEVTGADGRGYGLSWDGQNLYALFTVDGTQGQPSEDFRRASSGATTGWLKTYGVGGGPKVTVIARLDPRTGLMQEAAYLSAINSGKSNSLVVTGVTVNASGNLEILANSWFAPRRPDGKPLTKVTTAGSPFAYTIEITRNLKQVVRTAAVGWT